MCVTLSSLGCLGYHWPLVITSLCCAIHVRIPCDDTTSTCGLFLCGLPASTLLPLIRMLKEGIGEVMEKEDCIQALSGQIFMGMVSSQYQARSDVVRLIEGLVNACIRFVYFSLEDELKSKVSCPVLFLKKLLLGVCCC